VVVGEKGVGNEGQRLEVKECQIPKTKVHRLEGFLDLEVVVVVVVVGRSTRVAVWLEGAPESADQAALVKHRPSLVARLGCSDYPSVPSLRWSDQVLAGRYTGADNDEESSVAGWGNAAGERVVVEGRSQIQSLRRGTPRPWSPI